MVNSILPLFDTKSEEEEGSASYGFTSEAPLIQGVYMVGPNMAEASASAEGEVTIAAWRRLLTTPITGTTDTKKAMEDARKALEGDETRLANQRMALKAREREYQNTMEHNRRRRPWHMAMAEKLLDCGHAAGDAILGEEMNGNPVYRTLAANLVVATTLAENIDLGPDHPAQEELHHVVTLLKTAVIQQDVVTASHDRLTLRSLHSDCSRLVTSSSRTHRTPNQDSSHNRFAKDPDASNTIDCLQAEREEQERDNDRLCDACDHLNELRIAQGHDNGNEVSSWHNFATGGSLCLSRRIRTWRFPEKLHARNIDKYNGDAKP